MLRNARHWVAAGLLALTLVVGGGGTPSPEPELFVELGALLALGIWAVAPASGDRPNPPDRTLWAGVAIFVAIPLIQLVPLPPSLWHALPGRAPEIAALKLIGKADSWRPISMAPYMTLASTLSLIPPIALLFLVSRLSLDDRTKLLGVIGVVGLAAGLIGMLQVASGNARWFLLYPYQIPRFATGFQANRNAGADIFLVAIMAIIGYCVTRRALISTTLGKLMLAAVIILLVLTTVLTGSRAGTIMLLMALGVGATMLFAHKRMGRQAWLIGCVTGIVVLGITAAAWDNAQLDRTWTRFSDRSETRPELWKDTVFAIGQTAPLGSGLGTFVPIMTAAERLEAVDTTAPNRAHNDYLEFALETGFAGVLLLIGIAVAIIIRGYRVLRSAQSKRQRVQAISGLGFLGILGLHSIVDYPMRSMAVAGLAAVGIGFLARVTVDRGEVRASV